MDNREMLEELRSLQVKIINLIDKVEKEEKAKANDYDNKMKDIIEEYTITNGNLLNKDKQTSLYFLLKEFNINKLTIYKILKKLGYKCKYIDNNTSWKDLEIIK